MDKATETLTAQEQKRTVFKGINSPYDEIRKNETACARGKSERGNVSRSDMKGPVSPRIYSERALRRTPAWGKSGIAGKK